MNPSIEVVLARILSGVHCHHSAAFTIVFRPGMGVEVTRIDVPTPPDQLGPTIFDVYDKELSTDEPKKKI